MESTFIMIKPNGVEKGLVGEILSRYEKSRLAVKAIKIQNLTVEKISGFYAEHKERPFFAGLVEFMTSGPVLLAVLQGENAIAAARTINGATNPDDADPGTIRYDFAPDVGNNVVHSSDSTESAAREVNYWFAPEDMAEFTPHSSKI